MAEEGKRGQKKAKRQTEQKKAKVRRGKRAKRGGRLVMKGGDANIDVVVFGSYESGR
jgi:hypothetical protein